MQLYRPLRNGPARRTCRYPCFRSRSLFQTSYEASKAIITSGKYALYNNKPDNKAQNFCDMFLKGNGDNGEYIFQKQYNVAGAKATTGTNVTHRSLIVLVVGDAVSPRHLIGGSIRICRRLQRDFEVGRKRQTSSFRRSIRSICK